MGNMLYQSSDNKSIIKGDKTAKPNNYTVSKSLKGVTDLTKTLTKTVNS